MAKEKKATKKAVAKTTKKPATKPQKKVRLTKDELMSKLAEATGLTKKAVTPVYEAVLSVIEKEVADGKEVSILGFGTFKTVVRAARKGKNPQTGKEIKIPKRTVPVFKVGKAFKDACNK